MLLEWGTAQDLSKKYQINTQAESRDSLDDALIF